MMFIRNDHKNAFSTALTLDFSLLIAFLAAYQQHSVWLTIKSCIFFAFHFTTFWSVHSHTKCTLIIKLYDGDKRPGTSGDYPFAKTEL